MNGSEIQIINEKLKGKSIQIPQSLYKYRPFDEFTFDSLEKGYLYLCQAKRLDDPSECTVSFQMQDYYDIETQQLGYRCVRSILELIKPHATAENFKKIEAIIACLTTSNGCIKRNWLLDCSFELQNYLPNEDCVNLVNWFGNIPEKMAEPHMRDKVEKLFSGAYHARELMGICSLTMLGDCEEMWKNYSANSSGYCVEYDMKNYKYNTLLYPVVYQDNRDNHIVSAIVADLISQLIFGFSNGELDMDRSRYFRMFLTKETKWEYQKEWRVLGDAGEKLEAPPIKAICLGSNASLENIEKMKRYCDKNNIVLKG